MEQYVIRNQKQLRCGITTGTCGAVAADAAAALLLTGNFKENVILRTPKGITVSVPVVLSGRTEKRVEFMVVKDSGDDPDVTNHTKIYTAVEKLPEGAALPETAFCDEAYPNLYLDAGEGIGRVMREGLEQKIGQAAINQVPRTMIFKAVDEIRRLSEYKGRLMITVRIPEGKNLAERTFNPRLGIVGGISVLGTSGILEPMSEKAIVDTIETQIRQLSIQGIKNILVTPGNYGQEYAAKSLHLKLSDSIKCSNYIGETLDLAVSYGMERFLLVGDLGKLVKLAAGIMNTHSRVADARCEILAVHTVLGGGSREMAEQIMNCMNTEEILKLLEEWKLKEAVMGSLCRKIQEHVSGRAGKTLKTGVILFSGRFGFLGQTKEAEELLKIFRQL